MSLPPGPAYDERGAARPSRARHRTLAGVLAACLLAFVGSVAGVPSHALQMFRTDHTFLHESSGRPVTWDNCKAIHYVVNPQGAPADWRPLVADATAEISAASGYVFVLDGTTTDHDFAAGRYQGNPVLVGWGVRREIGRLGEGAAGYGGPITYDTDHGPQYGSGIVLFDSLYFDGLDRRGDRDDMQMIVAHEFMHVLGLGHVDRTDQVMGHAGREVGGTHLGEGDIAGLRALHDVPCP